MAWMGASPSLKPVAAGGWSPGLDANKLKKIGPSMNRGYTVIPKIDKSIRIATPGTPPMAHIRRVGRL